MKIIYTIILGLLIIGTNVFAAGDLIVNGQIGVGTAAPNAKAEFVAAGLIVQDLSFIEINFFLKLLELEIEKFLWYFYV